MSPRGVAGLSSYVYKDVRHEPLAPRAPAPDPRAAPAPRGDPARQRGGALPALWQAELPLRRGRGPSRHLPDRHAQGRAYRADLSPRGAGSRRNARGRSVPRLVGGDREAVGDQPRADPAATSATAVHGAAAALCTPFPPTAAPLSWRGLPWIWVRRSSR